MKVSDGGPVFPQPLFDSSGERVGYNHGVSLRDWFAGTVNITDADFPGSSKASSEMLGLRQPENSVKSPKEWIEWIAAVEAFIRYKKADAMIAEREKQIAPASTT